MALMGAQTLLDAAAAVRRGPLAITARDTLADLLEHHARTWRTLSHVSDAAADDVLNLEIHLAHSILGDTP